MLLEKIKLEPNEKIIKQTRRHWFVIASQIAMIAIVAIVPLVLFILIATKGGGLGNFVANYTAFFGFAYLLWIAFSWIGVFNMWTNHYLDVLTITDRRVVVVNQKGFFWRVVASFRLERMQDMNTEVNGLLPTLLNYGTIAVETAGDSDEEFRITGVPDPSKLKSLILQAADNRITSSENHDDLSGI